MLQSMGSQRVGHDSMTELYLMLEYTLMKEILYFIYIKANLLLKSIGTLTYTSISYNNN